MKEQELINLITHNLPRESGDLKVGIGDDCAVIAQGDSDLLITTDALFEGVHFDFQYTTEELLGRKSLTVNLSDIAAMGGSPLYYTVSLGVPTTFSKKRIESLYKGIKYIANLHQVLLIGGDTCISRSGLAISITAIGQTKKSNSLLRKGARVGDAIYVTGTFGNSALGLECFKRGLHGERYASFLKAYNDPVARLDEGRWLSSTGMITSAIDVSDGLLSDLSLIARASGVGFDINASDVPVDKNFGNIANELELDPFKLALTGGEDYELIFTVDANRSSKFENLLNNRDMKCVGRITDVSENFLVRDGQGNKLVFKHTGYDHFISNDT